MSTDPFTDDLARTQRALERAMKMLDEMKAERDRLRRQLDSATRPHQCSTCGSTIAYKWNDGDHPAWFVTEAAPHPEVLTESERARVAQFELEAKENKADLARVTAEREIVREAERRATAFRMKTRDQRDAALTRAEALAKRVETLEGVLKIAQEALIDARVHGFTLDWLRKNEHTVFPAMSAALAAPSVASAPTREACPACRHPAHRAGGCREMVEVETAFAYCLCQTGEGAVPGMIVTAIGDSDGEPR